MLLMEDYNVLWRIMMLLMEDYNVVDGCAKCCACCSGRSSLCEYVVCIVGSLGIVCEDLEQLKVFVVSVKCLTMYKWFLFDELVCHVTQCP